MKKVELTTGNENLPVPLIASGIVIVFVALYFIRYRERTVLRDLKKIILLFLLLYFPIVEYWSIWTSWSLWPDGFLAYDQIVVSETANFFENHQQYYWSRIIYNGLATASPALMYLSIILFLHMCYKKIKSTTKVKSLLMWIPVVNILIITNYLFENTSGKWIGKTLVLFWSTLTFIWMYYQFIAGPLVLVGIDSFSVLGEFIYGIPQKDIVPIWFEGADNVTPYINYSYVKDLMNILLPIITYFSALFTLVLILKFDNVLSSKAVGYAHR